MINFLPEEIEYYSRQLLLPEWNERTQLKLKGSKVLVVGAGALGCAVIQSLSRAGIGLIGIVDDDTVHFSNLQRQILFNTEDLGRKKPECVAEKIKIINPYIHTETYCHRIDDNNAESILCNYDIVVDGSDNFPTKYLLNDVCNILKKPLVYAAIEAFQGQVSVFHANENCPTYRCLFHEVPKENSDNCSTIGVSPFLPQIIGGLQAAETIKLITGMGKPLVGELLIYHAELSNFSVFKFNLNPENKKSRKKVGKLFGQDHPQVQALSLNKYQEDIENFFLVDVRPEDKYLNYNLGGVNIPLHELEESLLTLPSDKFLLTCCETGTNAKQAALILSHHLKKPVFYLDHFLNSANNSLQ